ncbi:MAG TPA: hypothetical protein P5320_02690 [Bacteroidales bacterium]|nr:hypothetical protein [Bacteroidales bacterium]HOK76007.1 hypothetical protein [Bacteroidales bacterium]HOM41031.1 hypothetical protein [Bacteroidales bacterium]HPP92119.1 hypothetical protein [Bacteroidales bacterium]HRR15604.1 hypothetical protein [Bacteroidales bacterium]
MGESQSSFVMKIESFVSGKFKAFASLQYNHESHRKIFSLPLLSVNLGFDDPGGKMRHAKGIIAIGTSDSGVIAVKSVISRGLSALAPLSFGGVTIGIFSISLACVSCLGIGIVSVSCFALGYLAVGIVAAGIKSVGILAPGESINGIVGLRKYKKLLFNF